MIVILAIGIPAIAFAALNAWLMYSLQQTQGRIFTRMEDLVRRRAGAAMAPAVSHAPRFVLPDLEGRSVSLNSLMTLGNRILLHFTDPKCGPCYELLADVGGWERVYGDRLTIVTVSGGVLEQNQALAREYGLRTILLQDEHELADAFELPMIPAAVLIEPDGRISDSTTGAARVRELVASALGLALPPQEAEEVKVLQPGETVSSLRRPDLDGNIVDLGGRRATPTMLVFWSPGCTHCRDLLADMLEWEADPRFPRMVVVTSGPVQLNRDAGLRAPMIQDDEGVLKRTFGVQGTPAAVVIDSGGRVVTRVARGASGVRAMVAVMRGQSTAAA